MPSRPAEPAPAGLARLRRSGLRLMLALQAASLAALGAEILAGHAAAFTVLPALLVMLSCGILARMMPAAELTRVLLAAGVMLQLTVLTIAHAGEPHHLTMHVTFFAALGLCAFALSLPAIAAGTLAAALHFAVTGYAMPVLGFGGAPDLPRLGLLLAVLLVAAGALAYGVRQVRMTLASSEQAAQVAREALAEAAGLPAGFGPPLPQNMPPSGGEDAALAMRGLTQAIGGPLRAAERAAAGLQQAASSLENIAAASSEGVDGAAETARAAANHVGSVAGAAGELSKSIAEIAGQLQSTSETVSSVRQAGEVSLQRMNELTAASEKIGDVINLIQAIAGQTNLLALNATIEAARAGEAGRGFAVVASEVKSLAAQTGRATDEIAAQIQAVQRATGESAGAIKAIVGRMIEVDQYVASIAAAVEEQDSTTRDMSHTMASAAHNSMLSSERIAAIRQKAGELGEVARRVADGAGQFREATEGVQAEIARVSTGMAA